MNTFRPQHLSPPSVSPGLRLHCHPATPCPIALQIKVFPTALTNSGKIRLDFVAKGDIHCVQVPLPVSNPTQTDGLWQHTCFEAFLASPTGPSYQEFNFSPSGQWARYRFKAERERDDAYSSLEVLETALFSSPSVLRLSTQINAEMSVNPIAWGLNAVIELDDGTLSYWALTHPCPHPDFHHPGGRTFIWSHNAV